MNVAQTTDTLIAVPFSKAAPASPRMPYNTSRLGSILSHVNLSSMFLLPSFSFLAHLILQFRFYRC